MNDPFFNTLDFFAPSLVILSFVSTIYLLSGFVSPIFIQGTLFSILFDMKLEIGLGDAPLFILLIFPRVIISTLSSISTSTILAALCKIS